MNFRQLGQGGDLAGVDLVRRRGALCSGFSLVSCFGEAALFVFWERAGEEGSAGFFTENEERRREKQK